MNDTNTDVRDNVQDRRFEIRVGGELAGFAEYERRPGRLVFTHTEVDPRFQGRGLAATLVAQALDSARDEQARVVPLCSYVAHYIDRHREYVELVDEDHRGGFAGS
jgi:predicted GNAT family acetyltransferase